MANVLLVGAHPDDITLWGSVMFIEHMAATPANNVHCLILTDGEGSDAINYLNGSESSPYWNSILHNPEAEQYPEMDSYTFGSYRIEEEIVALNTMASGLPGELTIHEGNLPDGEVAVEDIKDRILEICDATDPLSVWRLKTHTYAVNGLEPHPDHRAAGQAVLELKAEDPDRFSDCRWYIMPNQWTSALPAPSTKTWDNPTNNDVRNRALHGYKAFDAWGPPSKFAIGMHSTFAIFNIVRLTPKCQFHT